MQTEKEYFVDRCISALHSESAGEYPLPDYNGDVKRILMIKPRVIPSGSFMSEDSLEISGVVSYDVVYLDSENKLTRADFSTDYDISVKVSGDEYVDSYVSTAVAAYNVRLIGPRKFSAKCSLESNVHICERRNLFIGGDAFDSYTPESEEVSVNIMRSSVLKGEEREYAEQMLTLEGAILDEVSVLMADAEVELKSVTPAKDGGLELKGDMRLALIYQNGDMPAEKLVKTLPYNESLTGEAVDVLASVDARVNVLSVKASVNPNPDGVSVVISVILEPGARWMTNAPLSLLTDAYLKERGTRCEYRDFNYSELVCADSAELDFSARCALSELGDFSESGEVLHTEAFARVDNCEIIEDKVKISGEIRFSAIACEVNADGARSYTAVKFATPFEEYVNVNCQIHANMRVECSVSAFDARMDVDNENAYFACSLAVRLALLAQRGQRCLGAVHLTEDEYVKDDSVITVYYPEDGESVFDIAKKFHSSVRRIAEDNSLSESVFSSMRSSLRAFGVKKLIIK